MTDQVDIAAIKLLDREYQVKCPPEKIADLQAAANYLDIKMREAMSGKTFQHDRIFMIAALNIASEFLELNRQKNAYRDDMNQRIISLQNKIDQALSD